MSIRPKPVKIVTVAALVFTAALLAGCDVESPPEGCRIEGPRHLMPGGVRVLRLGMTKDKVESILSESATDTSVEGQYYFNTGGDCPLDDTGRTAPCGVVAEFRADSGEGQMILTETMQSCWWGAIEE